MSYLDSILKMAQWSRDIQGSISFSNQITELLKAQQRITEPLSGIRMLTEITSNRRLVNLAANPVAPVLEALTMPRDFGPGFTIPETTFNAIASINRQHEQLFDGFRGITEMLRIQSPAITQVNNLYSALNSISAQLTTTAAQQSQWSLIDDFEEITDQAFEFSEALAAETTEVHQKKFQVLLSLIIAFVKKYKSHGVAALLIIDIFLRFAGIHQYFDFLKDKPEPATKKEVSKISIKQDSVLQYLKQVESQLKQADQYRITNRACEVKLKPSLRTITLTKLPEGYETTVIQIHQKWVYVSYYDPDDNLPQNGWIMKKYIDPSR